MGQNTSVRRFSTGSGEILHVKVTGRTSSPSERETLSRWSVGSPDKATRDGEFDADGRKGRLGSDANEIVELNESICGDIQDTTDTVQLTEVHGMQKMRINFRLRLIGEIDRRLKRDGEGGG
ncbi:hypothetical protein Tco_1110121 [Tanacetum coccineum]|uniref:Uncharacterized protein n=1 Tax=Tanacetum coccineum TaxID=301880 RepID=A0ABQ5II26_9ASTR